MFKIGDTVVANELSNLTGKDLKGKTGRVVYIAIHNTEATPWVGVDFDNDIHGHSADGKARGGHGWWLQTSMVEHCVINLENK